MQIELLVSSTGMMVNCCSLFYTSKKFIQIKFKYLPDTTNMYQNLPKIDILFKKKTLLNAKQHSNGILLRCSYSNGICYSYDSSAAFSIYFRAYLNAYILIFCVQNIHTHTPKIIVFTSAACVSTNTAEGLHHICACVAKHMFSKVMCMCIQRRNTHCTRKNPTVFQIFRCFLRFQEFPIKSRAKYSSFS